MSMYVNEWGEHVALPNATVVDEQRSAKVTFHSEGGKSFSVVVRQKPNPIGFTAKMPGSPKGAR